MSEKRRAERKMSSQARESKDAAEAKVFLSAPLLPFRAKLLALSLFTYTVRRYKMAQIMLEQFELTPASTAPPSPRASSPALSSASSALRPPSPKDDAGDISEISPLPELRTAENASYPPSEMTPSGMETPQSEEPQAYEPDDSKEAFESYPDSGVLAWTQVASAFALFFTTMGGVYSWGVFQDALVSKGLAPSSTLAFIGSTQATLEAVFAIPIGRLVSAYGPRRIAILGSICTGLGPIIAGSCTNNFAALLVTEGLLYGLGAALCFFSVATLPSQ